MAKVIMYSTAVCPYCIRAEKLLEELTTWMAVRADVPQSEPVE